MMPQSPVFEGEVNKQRWRAGVSGSLWSAEAYVCISVRLVNQLLLQKFNNGEMVTYKHWFGH